MKTFTTSLLIAVLAAGCGAPMTEPGAETTTIQSAVARGGVSRPFRRTYLGRFRPSTAQWTLDLTIPGGGSVPLTTVFGYGNPNDTPLVGDWDGDGVETQGVWRRGQWLLANTLGKATADVSFTYGQAGDLPVVGDWDGDGKATPAYYRNGTFFFRDSNSAGAPARSFGFGDPGDIPLAGDWNGDGVDTIGVYDPVHAVFLLTNAPVPNGVAEIVVPLGDPGQLPLVGDWDTDGKTTIGVSAGTKRFLLNYMGQSAADIYVDATGAAATDIPISGNWDPTDLPRPQPAPTSLTNFFPIGVWAQYADDFPKWRARGINTELGVPTYALPPLYPNAETIDNWTNAANCVGLSGCTQSKMMRIARPDPNADRNEANLLAWLPVDEPDSGGLTGADAAAATYQQLKTAQNPRPVVFDLTGRKVFDPVYDATNTTTLDQCEGPGDYPSPAGSCYPKFIANEDWIMHDFYPLNFAWEGVPSPVPLGDIRTVARMMDKISRWSNKPQFVFVEASPKIYSAADVGPTPAQLRAEIWLAIIHGARGITYFTYSGCNLDDAHWCPDGVAPDVATEMTTQNARITSLASVIQSPINPPALGFSITGTASAPTLEAAWRQLGGHNYLFVLNTSPNAIPSVGMRMGGLPATAGGLEVVGESRSLQLKLHEQFIDGFQPYELHVYKN